MSQETQAAQDSASQDHVDIGSKEALARWAKALGTTTEALESAVQVVGTRVDKLKDHMTAGMAGRQQGG